MPNESDSGPVTINQLPTLREINERNRKFWEEHSSLGDPHMEVGTVQQDLMKFRKRPSDFPTHQEVAALTDAATENETPEQYLEKHDFTRKLKRLGVTSEQLQGMRFGGTNKGWAFDQWSFGWPGTIPPAAIPLVKSYCALKWLVLENPAYSRDREDAWRFVGETMAAPNAAIGERTREAQSERAKKPRGKITDDGRTIGQVIGKLAVQPQHQSDTAGELWPHLSALLDEEDLNPKEIKNPRELAYEYGFNDRRKKITFRRFENIVAKARKSKRSH